MPVEPSRSVEPRGSVELSVVVPFHDAEPHLAACLESLARQTLRDLEVIMVDDGSADGGAVVAKARAARDPRFTLLQRDRRPDGGQGLGPARDLGARHASGTYLAFVDGGDVVPRHALELLVGSLRLSGSDLAGGGVRRPADGRPLVPGAYRETAVGTHVRRRPALVEDGIVGNKVYRRSFWDEHGFAFPGGPHEDAAVAIRTHVRARAVDVLADTVCYRRAEPPEGTRAELELRAASVCAVRDLLAGLAPDLLTAYETHALRTDLGALAEAVCRMPAGPDRDAVMACGQRLLHGVAPEALAAQRAHDRIRFRLFAAGLLDELAEFHDFRRHRMQDLRYVRRGLFRPRWYAAYPLFEDAERNVPQDAFEVTAEIEARGAVDEVSWSGGRLRISGHAYLDRVPMTPGDQHTVKVWLRERRSGRRVPLAVRRTVRSDVTARAGHALVCYDGSGFTAELEPDALRVGGAWREARWELHAEVAVPGRRGERRLGNPVRGRGHWPPATEVAPGVLLQPVAEPGAGFRLDVRPVRAMVTGWRTADGTVELTGFTRFAPLPEARLTARRVRGGEAATAELDCIPAGDGTHAFHAVLPAAALHSGGDAAEDEVPRCVDDVYWRITLHDGAKDLPLTLDPALREHRFTVADREIVLTRSRYGNLRAVERAHRPVVRDCAWLADGTLHLGGDHLGGRPARLTLRRRTGETRTVPLSWDGAAFTAEFAPHAVLTSGTWEAALDGRPVMVARDRIAALPAPRTGERHEIEPGVREGDALRLTVRPALPEEERGRYAQGLIQRGLYPVLCGTPLRDTVVFDADGFARYAGDPRAVHEELLRRGTDLDCVWLSRRGDFTVPDGGRTVLLGTRESYEILATARYIVGNWCLPEWFVKRPGQFYAQCGQGTPFERGRPGRWPSGEPARWDLMVAPNEFAAKVWPARYGYAGPITVTGAPRNDVLHRPDRAETAARVRAGLGLPADRKAVLYAPAGPPADLDLGLLRRALGHDHVLLLRTRPAAPGDGEAVVDVSGHGDMADLLAVADVLVTDHSPVMADFAGTGRPILLFGRETPRDLIVDLDKEAPGPLLRTCGELADAIGDLDAVARAHTAARRAFAARFCAADDGHAAARVADLVFGPDAGTGRPA
ncbi:bifunctional glycosyltransferase/CDP-glycerol:glycerophosphate glycerophosphotransferase [Actinomadura macrotermitis]|uniref:Glycosyltransferase 2-like domain-containing protein n=1 Tax=Actinomadura macrotermitis TaxID=2585200 RepID=A0A7K0C281_9ACTN|nr:CDP-glycerol glycerophosphotransferase family protein [Actinomadura macrotermitis]MQY07520.1 hypothetical protein [Actinomadura macrotermitis]